MEGNAEPHALAWEPIGSTTAELISALRDMYWSGVQREVFNIARVLHSWIHCSPPLATLEEEENQSDRWTNRIWQYIQIWDPMELSKDGISDVFIHSRDYFYKANKQTLLHRRARSLLQAAGFLDFDKLIENRLPILPSHGGSPQVLLLNADNPAEFFVALCCDCRAVIRGFHYACILGCTTEESDFSVFLCQQCYTKGSTAHPIGHLQKRAEQRPIPPALAKTLCECPDGRDAYAPVVYTIGDFLEAAKESGETDFLGHLKSCRLRDMQRAMAEATRDIDKLEDSAADPWKRRFFAAFPNLAGRTFYPMGNTHVALMFGPLLIENGVKASQGGALFTFRDPPDLTLAAADDNNNDTSVLSTDYALALSPNSPRTLYKTHRLRTSRRLDMVVKQVMGGLFSGFEPRWSEMETKVIDRLIFIASELYKPDEKKSRNFNKRQVDKLWAETKDLVKLLKYTLDGDVSSHLSRLAGRLFDPHFKIRWSQYRNNCQIFCNKLLEDSCYSTVFPANHPGPDSSNYPQYLVSFMARLPHMVHDKGLAKSRPSAYYLGLFHRSEDIIDHMLQTDPTLQLTNERILLWRCKAVHGQKACKLVDHVWKFPSEAASILQFHLLRSSARYALGNDDAPITFQMWAHNRLEIMNSLDMLMILLAAIRSGFEANYARNKVNKLWAPPDSKELGRVGGKLGDGQEQLVVEWDKDDFALETRMLTKSAGG